LQVKKATTWKEIPFALLAAVIVMLLANDAWYRSGAVNQLGRWDSLILLTVFAVFLIYTWKLSKKGDVEVSDVKVYSILITIGAIVFGLAGLILGGKIVVTNAVKIAEAIGISQKIIGLTIVAAGTSLPELATSVTAALKKHPDIAIGNIVGSNIFNILFILGASSMMTPLPYHTSFNTDFLVMYVATIALFGFMFSSSKHKIDRWEGGLLVVMYILYTSIFLK
jgi:cation:H+ antiporter